MTGEYRSWSGIDFRPVRKTILPHALLPYLREGSRILDVGCNQGGTALFLGGLGHRVHGIDINPDAIAKSTCRAQELGLSAAVHFEVADLLELESGARYDAVTLVRFLTCLPDVEDWRAAAAKAGAVLTAGGLLYVNDFLCTPESEEYRARYEQGVARGWRYGNFAVHHSDGTLNFVAHHHTPEDLAELSANYRTEMLQSYPSVSLHGNSVMMFELILRKTDLCA